MTVQLRQKLETLRALAPTLNATTSRAGDIIESVEAMLGSELSLGITTEGPYFDLSDAQDDEGRDLRTTTYLSYERIGERFRLCVVSETGELIDGGWNQTLERTPTPWSSCPRGLKLKSFVRLPELLERIADNAKALSDEASKAADTIDGLMGADGE